MRYRKLSPTGDYVFGQQQSDFWVNVPDAVAQAVSTRLRLWTGNWFLNTAEGTDWSGKILGNRTALTRDAELRQRILNTPGATQIVNYSTALDPNTRRFTASFQIETQFGAYAGQQQKYYVPLASPADQPPSHPINVAVTELTDTSVNVTWDVYSAPT